MGRKDVYFGFVMDQREREALDAIAELEGGLSRAATLRRLIHVVARAGNVWPEEGPGEEDNGNRGAVSA